MKKITFTATVRYQPVYLSTKGVRVSYTNSPYAAILQHIEERNRDGFNADFIRKELLPFLPLASSTYLIQEFKRKEYVSSVNDPWDLSGLLSEPQSDYSHAKFRLTEWGKEVAESGTYHYELPDEKAIAGKLLTLGDFHFPFDLRITNSRDDLETKSFIELEQTEFPALNGAECTLSVGQEIEVLEATKRNPQSKMLPVQLELQDKGLTIKEKNGDGKTIARIERSETLEDFLASFIENYEGGKILYYHNQNGLSATKLVAKKRIDFELTGSDLGLDCIEGPIKMQPLQFPQLPANKQSAIGAFYDELWWEMLAQPIAPLKEVVMKVSPKVLKRYQKTFGFDLKQATGGNDALCKHLEQAFNKQKRAGKAEPDTIRGRIMSRIDTDLEVINTLADPPKQGFTLFKRFPKSWVKRLIRGAQEALYLQSNLLEDTWLIDELEKAATENGIRVYILHANHVIKNNEHQLSDDFRTESQEALMQRLASFAVVRHHSWAHAKFLVVDPQSETPHGFFSTGNFTVKAMEENPERYAKLGGQQTRLVARRFRELFGLAKTELGWKDQKLNRTPTTKQTIKKAELFNYENAYPFAFEKLESVFQQAKTIEMGTYNLDDKHPIMDLLLAAKKKVKIHYSKMDPKAQSRLQSSGAKLQQNSLWHAKYLHFKKENGEAFFLFSGNFDEMSLRNPYELILLM